MSLTLSHGPAQSGSMPRPQARSEGGPGTRRAVGAARTDCSVLAGSPRETRGRDPGAQVHVDSTRAAQPGSPRQEQMMARFDVAELSALEILDSRGRPTLAVTVVLGDGTRRGGPGCHPVRLTGSREAAGSGANGDPAPTGGKGVLGAVAAGQRRLPGGAAARPGVGLAGRGRPGHDRSRRHPQQGSCWGRTRSWGCQWRWPGRWPTRTGVALWRWLTPEGVAPSLPVPHFNVLNGGVHAP